MMPELTKKQAIQLLQEKGDKITKDEFVAAQIALGATKEFAEHIWHVTSEDYGKPGKDGIIKII